MNKVVFVLLAAILFAAPSSIQAQVIESGVNFLDPLKYQKPQYVPVYGPNEETTTNKYYLNFSSGAGTSCTSAAPCKQLRNLVGKPGMSGGPAIVYVMGASAGAFHMYGTSAIGGSGDQDCFVKGNCTNWILIRPWPAGVAGCQTEMCQAEISGTNSWRGVAMHHMIIDGGANLKIKFRATVTGSFEYVWQISNSSYITTARTNNQCNSISSTARLWAVGNGAVVRNFTMVNNEFGGCNNDDGSATSAQISSAYWGASDGGGWQNGRVINNVIHHMSGDGVEFNTRAASSGLLVEGNAIHHVGRGTCAHADWDCRPGLTFHSQNGQPSTGIVARNNLIWMTGSGCAYTRVSGIQFDYNVCLNWAQDNHQGGTIDNPTALVDSPGNTTGRGNIFVSFNGANPIDSGSYNLTGNMCMSGESCGSSVTQYTTTTFKSIDQNSPDFLKLATGSPALDKGPNVTGLTKDYAGATRPQGSANDLGAFEGFGVIDPDKDCVFTWPETWETVSIGACVNNSQTVTQRRAPIITEPATGNGKACPAPETRTVQQSCTLPTATPPSLTQVCTIVLKDSAIPPDNTGGWTVVYRRSGSIVTFPDVVVEGSHSYTAEWTKAGVGVVISPTIERVCKGD